MKRDRKSQEMTLKHFLINREIEPRPGLYQQHLSVAVIFRTGDKIKLKTFEYGGDVQEKLSMEKRLDDNDAYIVSLQEKIKSLVTEKDSLAGRTKMLEEEREMYKVLSLFLSFV